MYILYLFILNFIFTLQYCIGFAIHWHESTMGVHEFPNMNPPPTPYHLSGSSPCTSPKHPVSCIEHRLALRFLHDSIHVSVPFPKSSHPLLSLSLTVQKCVLIHLCLFCCLAYSHHYHLSKFHIYVSVYCMGVFLSGLHHSV